MPRVPLKLKKPIAKPGSQGSEFITELSFRDEIVAGDLRGIRFSDLKDPMPEHYLAIGARLCGQTDAVMQALSLSDLAEVVALVSGFIKADGGPTTGESSSPS